MPKQWPSARCLCPQGPCGVSRRLALSSYRRCRHLTSEQWRRPRAGSPPPFLAFPSWTRCTSTSYKTTRLRVPSTGPPTAGMVARPEWETVPANPTDPGAGRSKCGLGCDSPCPTVMQSISEDGGVCVWGGGGQGEEKKSNLNECKGKGLGRDRSQRTYFKQQTECCTRSERADVRDRPQRHHPAAGMGHSPSSATVTGGPAQPPP